MRAYQIVEYGMPETHKLVELDEPEIGADEVLLKNEAIGLNFPDALMVQGKYQKRPDPPFVPGRDCAGIVLRVGQNVKEFAPGDPVVAQVFSGAFSDVVCAPVERVFHRPAEISSIDAAGAITVFNTAYVAVSIRAKVKKGTRVVVTGAAGGVGIAVVQLATALGARVVGIVSNQEKADLVLANGAEQAIMLKERTGDGVKAQFKSEVRTAWGDDRGADVVIDTVGGDVFHAGLRCLGFAGQMVVVGFASADIPYVRTNYLLYNNLAVLGAPLDIHFAEALEEIRAGTEWWLGLLKDGKAKANVTDVLPYDQLMSGLQALLDRKISGNLVVRVGGT